MAKVYGVILSAPMEMQPMCGLPMHAHVARALRSVCEGICLAETADVLPALDQAQIPWETEAVIVVAANMPLLSQHTLRAMWMTLSREDCAGVSCGMQMRAACFRPGALRQVLAQCTDEQPHGTVADAVQRMEEAGMRVQHMEPTALEDTMCVTGHAALAQATRQMRARINDGHMDAGVTLIDPATTYIDVDVRIGEDVVIHPGNTLEGASIIGPGCVLMPGNRLTDSELAQRVTVERSVLVDAKVGEQTTVGPFAFLRPASVIGAHCRIGDFVEIKNSSIGDKTKVSHLTYVGDSDLGQDINLGCGVVFVNYDGKHKSRSRVEDHAFIGCNVNLVAPVRVGKDAYVAAGSTVTEDVPEAALCIARQRQIVKEGWVAARQQAGKL